MGATACCTIQESQPEILKSLTPKQDVDSHASLRATSSQAAAYDLPHTPIGARIRSRPTTFQLRFETSKAFETPPTTMSVSATSTCGVSVHPPINVNLVVDTLATLKRQIQDRTGIASKHQTLVFGTKCCTALPADVVLGSFFFEEPMNIVRKRSKLGSSPVTSPRGTLSLPLPLHSMTSSRSGSNLNSPCSATQQRSRNVTKTSSISTSPGNRRPLTLGSVSSDVSPSAAAQRRVMSGLCIDGETSPVASLSGQTSLTTPFMRDDACMPLSLDFFETMTQTTSMMTWTFEEIEGAWHHNPSGMHISPDRGVQVDGSEYGLPPESIEINKDRRLGSGSGGSVFMGHHKPTGMPVAVKALRVCEKAKRDQMLKEIRGLILASGSEHLIQLYAGFVGQDSSMVNVVIEFMDRGSLADLRKSLGGKGMPSSPLACISSQILRGLEDLQTRRLLHRDVKPENILHNRNGRVKLTDFGLSKDLSSISEGDVGSTFVGTATYMSPERVSGDDYSFQSDVWSAGMVIYELASGHFPFSGTSFMDLCDCICEGPPLRLEEVCKDYPQDLCELVARCLTRDKDARPAATELLESCEFIRSQGENEVAALAAWLLQLEQSR